MHSLGHRELILEAALWGLGACAVERSPLVPVSGTLRSGTLRAGCQVSCPEQMLQDRERWVDPRIRSSWKSGPKLRSREEMMEAVEGRCPRVSDGETEAQKQVP